MNLDMILEDAQPPNREDALVGGAPPDRDLELMFRALESPRGIRMSHASESAAKAARFRLYRRRNAERKTGNHTLDSLIIRVIDNNLEIVPTPPLPPVLEL